MRTLPALLLSLAVPLSSADVPARRAPPAQAAALARRGPPRDTDRFFALISDVFQSLHRCHWATQVGVDGRQALVPLVLALNEQSQRLNEARSLLLKHADEPLSDVRQAVEGLLRGVQLLSLANAADQADINVMNDRYELAQKMDGRREDRLQALDVMAASTDLLAPALYGEVPGKEGRRARGVRRPRLSKEDLGSLKRQLDLFFGADLEALGAMKARGRDASDASPLLEAVADLRRALEGGPPAAAPRPARRKNKP